MYIKIDLFRSDCRGTFVQRTKHFIQRHSYGVNSSGSTTDDFDTETFYKSGINIATAVLKVFFKI